MIPETNNNENTAPEGWTREDWDWIQKLKPEFKNCAKTHGRKLFSMVMQAGVLNHALQIILQKGRQSPEVHAAVAMISQNLNSLFQQAIVSNGFTQEKFNEAKRDIEIVGAILTAPKADLPPSAKISPGGIILNG